MLWLFPVSPLLLEQMAGPPVPVSSGDPAPGTVPRGSLPREEGIAVM